jgi:CMP-N-acetylneuraminic acid synthetase
MNKKVIAIIPARGGSKRLPNKNILNLKGKPLIAWTINAIKDIQLDGYDIDTIVSTDDDKIASVAKEYGSEIPFIRPSELSTDLASSMDVIKHALTFLEKEGRNYDIILLLQPTSPLRTKQDIEEVLKLIDKSKKAIISVTEVDHSPLWSNTLPKDLSMNGFIRDEVRNKRSQDLPTYYRLNGAIYCSYVSYFYDNDGFLGKNTYAYIMPRERSIDIDTELDFNFIKAIIAGKR